MKEHTRYSAMLSLISNPKQDVCIPWDHCHDAQGYGRIWYGNRTVSAARLVFFVTHGKWPKPLVRHTCDKSNCINPLHLIEGTYADNVGDTIRRGRINPLRGEKQRNSKLTEAIVREIRASSESHQKLADRFGVTRRYIGRVREGMTWKHVICNQ